MNVVRIVKGELFFDEFDSDTLNSKWLMVPNDSLRYSLVERPGYLKLSHGSPDLVMLIDEPADHYILDIRNEYVPFNSSLQAGLVAFKTYDQSLEVLEYYDPTKDSSIVYEYIRLVRSFNLYTAYGRNHSSDPWELIGTGEFKSSGKVGMIIKGNAIVGASDFNVDFFRIYKSNEVQVINVPAGYRVEICDESLKTISAKKVTNPYSGVSFTLSEIPPIRALFKVYDDTYNLVSTSSVFDVVGGDVYFYGAFPLVQVNSEDVMTDGVYFLGYFTSTEINFTVTLTNPYPGELTNLILKAVQYSTDIGYQFVTFCNTHDGTFTPEITVSSIPTESSVTVYGKITRDMTVVPSDIEPFKFNLALSFV